MLDVVFLCIHFPVTESDNRGRCVQLYSSNQSSKKMNSSLPNNFAEVKEQSNNNGNCRNLAASECKYIEVLRNFYKFKVSIFFLITFFIYRHVNLIFNGNMLKVPSSNCQNYLK